MVSPDAARAALAAAPWLRRAETQRIMHVLDGLARRTRVVGGIVRDTMLGHSRTDGDIDMATELLPQEVMRRGIAAGMHAHPTGFDHGTVTLRLGDTVAEVTTLRQDVTTDGRRAVVRFGSDWTRDAERRDFTFNALYADVEGNLFDPIGGLEDCLAGRVRFIGDAERRIAEDRLRVYRFFRFSASHGGQHFDRTGLEACRRAAGTLDRLSAERVGAEMRRILSLRAAAVTLAAMSGAGVLPLPPDALTLLAEYEARADPPTLQGRLAIFASIDDPSAVQRRWRLANAEIAAALAVLDAMRLIEDGRINEAVYRHRPALADALILSAARNDWEPGRVERIEAAIAALHIPRFPVTGRDLTERGYRQGRALGRELARLESLWIESGFALDRPGLLASVRRP